jgi:diaminopimelate decarboxylase
MASNYNMVGRPPVVAVRAGADRIVLRRETQADLFALDPVLAAEPVAVPLG